MKAMMLAAAAAMAMASAAQAAVVIDQSAWLTPSGQLALSNSAVVGDPSGASRFQVQSLTAGISGRLTRVDLLLWRGAGFSDLEIGVARGLVGTPSLSVIGLVPVARASVPTQAQVLAGGFLSVDLSAFNIIVHPGQTLSVGVLPLVQDPCCNVYRWVNGEIEADTGNIVNPIVYDRGFNQITLDGGDTWTPTGLDRGFRTWVDTSAVPEPRSWAMLVAGFAAIGGTLRRRRIAPA